MLNRWNFLKTGFYEGIKVHHRAAGDAVGQAGQLPLSQQTALAEKRILMENIVEWAGRMGGSLDGGLWAERGTVKGHSTNGRSPARPGLPTQS